MSECSGWTEDQAERYYQKATSSFTSLIRVGSTDVAIALADSSFETLLIHNYGEHADKLIRNLRSELGYATS